MTTSLMVWGSPRTLIAVELYPAFLGYKLRETFGSITSVSRYWRLSTAQAAFDWAVTDVEAILEQLEAELSTKYDGRGPEQAARSG